MLQKIIFFMKENCLLCDEVYPLVDIMAKEYALSIESIDIYTDEKWLEKYHIDIPVVRFKDLELKGTDITLENLERMLQLEE